VRNRLQIRGQSVAVSEMFTVRLSGPASQGQPPGIFVHGSAPERTLHEGEEFGVALFASAGTESIDAFQLRVQYEPEHVSFLRMQQSGTFMCALSQKC